MDTPSSTQKPKALSPLWATFSFVCAGIVVGAAVLLSFVVAYRIDASNRANLLTRISSFAYLTDADAIAGLSGTSADLQSDAYNNIKNTLYDLRRLNPDARFIYFMRSNNTKLYFLVDSEHPDSKDYSPPGQVYEDTSPLEFSNYGKAATFTEGPYTDEWGTWVSAYAPVRTTDGAMTAIIGMDVDAYHWKQELVSAVVGISLIGLLIAGLFIVIGLYFRRTLGTASEYRQMHASLESKMRRTGEVLARAHVGQWSLTPATGAFACDDLVSALFGLGGGNPSKESLFVEALPFESQTIFKETLTRAFEKSLTEGEMTLSAKNGKHIKLSFSISYGANASPLRVSGVAQEVQGA